MLALGSGPYLIDDKVEFLTGPLGVMEGNDFREDMIVNEGDYGIIVRELPPDDHGNAWFAVRPMKFQGPYFVPVSEGMIAAVER